VNEWAGLSDLVASALLIGGIKAMSHPRFAHRGIVLAGWGMLIAVAGNILAYGHLAPETGLLAGAAILLGGGVAWLTSRQVAMTAMPQMVALFNGLGGGAAALIVVTQLLDPASLGGLALGFGLLALTIGTLSFGGSLVAFTKLAGRLRHPWRFRYQNSLHLIWLGLIVLVGAGFFILSEKTDLTAIFVALALGLGISTTVPIGGADMPVVISFYNALTGLAVGVDGLLLKNPALLIAGTVVGASGTLLTRLMAKAMNRSLGAVLFAHFGSITATGTGEGTASKEMDLTDAAVSLAYARKIRIVPGYGLATAQAQHKLAELTEWLRQKGVEVRFPIHPVAGRMPGHMNVLLAEAGIPYELIQDLEEANPEFPQVDVVLVIGANDVINPDARNNPGSPLYGMPILEIDRAPKTLVIKRGQGTGFAGVANPLFTAETTYLLYGDAREVLNRLLAALKSL